MFGRIPESHPQRPNDASRALIIIRHKGDWIFGPYDTIFETVEDFMQSKPMTLRVCVGVVKNDPIIPRTHCYTRMD